jgi:hypothetical protein
MKLNFSIPTLIKAEHLLDPLSCTRIDKSATSLTCGVRSRERWGLCKTCAEFRFLQERVKRDENRGQRRLGDPQIDQQLDNTSTIRPIICKKTFY